MLKRFISSSKVAIIATFAMFIGIFNGYAVSATATSDTSDLFDYVQSGDMNKANLKSTYKTLLEGNSTTEIIYPEQYESKNVIAGNMLGMYDPLDEYVTSIQFNTSQNISTSRDLAHFQELQKIVYPYIGTDFLFQGNLAADEYEDLITMDISDISCNKLGEIYIYATSVKFQEEESGKKITTFKGINENVKIYVSNESVKNTIVSKTANSDYPVAADNIEIMKSSLPESDFTISCNDIFYGEANGFSPKASINAGDGNITYKLYEDQECSKEASYSYNSPYLPIGTYYLKGIMAATENYQGSESQVLPVQVKKKNDLPTESTLEALNDAIAAANTFYEENQYHKDDFDTTAWNAVYRSPGALSKAQEIVADEEGLFSNDDAVKATENLTEALEALKKASADLTESWESLSKLITQAEEIVAKVDNGEVKYTEETYEKLTKELKSAKDLLALKDTEESVTKSRIQSEINYLQAAIDGLEKGQNGVEPGKPFSYIQKGGKAANVASLTADKDMAGVTKIKLTFDCAEDVSFNEYATIDVDATVAGTQSYKQFAGNNYTEGGTNFVELPLTAAVKEGDSIELKVSTWSWDNAKDYVYGITKVEFINDKGEIAHTIIDKDIFKESLTASIADAEKINTSVYTEESVAALTKAIEAAKALTDDATAEELEKAIQDIDEAIKGLTKKTSGPDKTDDGKTEDSTTKVIGTAKGKTFTVGNFQYKVTVAATITGTKKAAGKVTVVGLTKTGKKKSSISVKNTVSKSGASYSVTAIASKAFKKATKLKKATLGTNVKAIPTSAFEGCKKLTTVSAKGVTKIGKKSFKNCKALKKLTLKKKVSVKKGAFKGCKKTIKVTGASKKVNKANVKKLKKSGYKKFK